LCRGSEWVELLIFCTPCLLGVYKGNFLFVVTFRYFSDTPMS
jgi:hypothetical protein